MYSEDDLRRIANMYGKGSNNVPKGFYDIPEVYDLYDITNNNPNSWSSIMTREKTKKVDLKFTPRIIGNQISGFDISVNNFENQRRKR